MNKAVCLLLLAVLVVPALGCDKVSPTAPSGSILTISANPAVISLNGSSTITVIGRKPNGSALNRGTEIRLTTTLGSIEPFVQVDSDGMATATLRGDGRPGVATITASTSSSGGTPTPPPTGGGTTPPPTGGSSTGTSSVSLSVEIGGTAKTLTLQATPTNIPLDETSQVRLLALIRDSRGQPLANASVNFLTEFGSLASGGRLLQSNAQGEVRDTLTVREDDLASEPPNVTVTAQTASGDGSLISATFDIQVRTNRLDASFTYAKGGSANEVDFDSTVSGGSASLDYVWDFGDGSPPVRIPDPSHTYADGNYRVTLTVTDRETGLSDTARASFTIPLQNGGNSN